LERGEQLAFGVAEIAVGAGEEDVALVAHGEVGALDEVGGQGAGFDAPLIKRGRGAAAGQGPQETPGAGGALTGEGNPQSFGKQFGLGGNDDTAVFGRDFAHGLRR
jgi:hypothetical protein